MQRESVFTNGVCPLGGDASCRCPSYLCWMLSSGMWRGSRGCSDGDNSSSAGDMNHSSAWSLLSFSLSHVSSPSTKGLPPRPHTAPQKGSRSLGSSGLKSPWPPESSLRCSSEIADKHRKDVTLFTVYVVRRFDALHGGGHRLLPLVLYCHLVSVKMAPSLLFLSDSTQKSQLKAIKWSLTAINSDSV